MHPLIIRRLHEAQEYAADSPDPYKKVGAVCLNEALDVMCFGMNHVKEKVEREDEWWTNRAIRRPFMIHAEQDMVCGLMRGATWEKHRHACVITLLPCTSCMTLLAACGFKALYYYDVYHKDLESLEVAKFYDIKVMQIPQANGAIILPHH